MSSSGKIIYSCVVPGCSVSYYVQTEDANFKNKHIFKAPKDIIRKQQWIDAINKFAQSNIVNTEKLFRVCENHFVENAFTNTLHDRLSKYAIPTIFQKSEVQIDTAVTCEVPGSSTLLSATTSIASNMGNQIEERTQLKQKNYILKAIGLKKVSDLSPKKKKLYNINRQQQIKIIKLRKALNQSTNKLKTAIKISTSKYFRDLEKELDPAGIQLLEAQLKNVRRKVPQWSIDNKILALALYKRGPRCYRFLQNFLKLPSRPTLQRLLHNFPFEAGINVALINRLKKQAKKMQPLNRYCTLIFDEMALNSGLQYDKSNDKIIGFVDLGSQGRSNIMANHALVFQLQGLRKSWKQPIAYYFTKDTVKTANLKSLLTELITVIQSTGLKVSTLYQYEEFAYKCFILLQYHLVIIDNSNYL